MSVKIDIRSILEESDLHIAKRKETNYNLRKTSVKRQAVNSERLKNSYVNRLIFDFSFSNIVFRLLVY